jgi:hypothetical protein
LLFSDVVNPDTKKPMTVQEAHEQKVLDAENKTYRTKDGEYISIHDAILTKRVIQIRVIKIDFGGGIRLRGLRGALAC